MEETPFKFTPIPKVLPTLCHKNNKVYLEKWYLIDRLKSWTFSFDQAFQHYAKVKFVKDFFTDDQVLSTVQQMSSNGGWSRIDKPASVNATELKCTVTSMDFFDKLKKEFIVRENGNICKCFDEFYEGITISDELRKMLLLEDSDNFECYSDDERSEVLFKIFSLFVIGGPICQYEDNVQPYMDMTKSLYKDLVCVQRHPETKALIVASKVYQVTTQNKSGDTIFPSGEEHEQTFAYLFVDPIKRHVTLLYHCWGKGLW